MPCEQYKYFITFKIVIGTGKFESDKLEYIGSHLIETLGLNVYL